MDRGQCYEHHVSRILLGLRGIQKEKPNIVFKKRLDTRRIAMFQRRAVPKITAQRFWLTHLQRAVASPAPATFQCPGSNLMTLGIPHATAQMQRCSGNSRNSKVSETKGIWSHQPLHRIMLVVLETQHDQSKDHQNFQRQLGLKVRTNLKVGPSPQSPRSQKHHLDTS